MWAGKGKRAKGKGKEDSREDTSQTYENDLETKMEAGGMNTL